MPINQVAEPEEEFEDAEFDGEDAGAGAFVSELDPDSLLAVTFSGSPLGLSLASLAWVSGCFAWLWSFSLFE